MLKTPHVCSGISQFICYLSFIQVTRYHNWFRLYATGRKVADLISDEVIGLLKRPSLSSRTMALELTQPLAEMSAMNLPEGKARPALKTENLTAICEPLIWNMR
jgi:hypothetical protein